MSDCLIVKGSGETDLPIVHIVHSLEEARHAVLSLMYSNPDDAEDTDELFAEFDDTMADDNYWTIAFEIGGISVERVCLAAPTQGADAMNSAWEKYNEDCQWGYEPTVRGIFEDGYRAAPTQGADARPVAIYQARLHTDEEKTWGDCYEATFYACKAYPDKYETRIVYAARDAAPSDALKHDAWKEPFAERHEFDTYPDHFMTGLRNEFAAGWHAAIKAIAASAPREET